jgi:hypothetical protein
VDPLHTENRSILIESVSKEGIVSVTGTIPGFGKTRRDLMTHLYACMIDQGADVPQQIFQDGTGVPCAVLSQCDFQPVASDL